MMTGGGTLGPVTPLLAVIEAWRRQDPTALFVWVGTKSGPERDVIAKQLIPFHGLRAPKLDRHAPLKWALIPFQLLWAMKIAVDLIRLERPDVVVTAGGYVSLPLVWTARLLGIPVWVHQQDVRAGLANLLMAPAASKVSVAWIKTMRKFPASKTIHVGNPVRPSISGGSRVKAVARFGLDLLKPTVLILGGGTGSMWLNETIARLAPDLVHRANILHLTGKGKRSPADEVAGYTVVDLIVDGMADVYALADVVVCRAGMGTISELSALRKPAIIIPIPASHQEDNTAVLAELDAAVIMDQPATTPQILLQTINGLLDDEDSRHKLGLRLRAALPTDGVAERLARLIQSLVKQ